MKITCGNMVTTPNLNDLLQDISCFFPNNRRITVHMLRLDQIHPEVSGNKWFKLKYNLEAAQRSGLQQLLTFGGAYSNHLVATAAAAHHAGLSSIGIVRGLHAQAQLTPTLEACKSFGMRLHFVDKGTYAKKEEDLFLKSLEAEFGPAYIIPEGGDNDLGRMGAGGIANYIPDATTTVCLPVGTGTTFSGLRNALPQAVRLIGFPAMKGGDYLKPSIAAHLSRPDIENWALNPDFAFNGFGKTTPELLLFIKQLYKELQLPLDVVYTGKMMFGMQSLIGSNAFAEGENIVCMHTGGLQGNPPGLFEY